MLLSLERLVLPVVLLLLSLTSNIVLSKHVTCRWKVGKGSPAQFSYVQYCEAGIIIAVNNNKTTSAEYRCPPNNVFKLGAKVAEWGKVGPQLLEWCESCPTLRHDQDESSPRSRATWLLTDRKIRPAATTVATISSSVLPLTGRCASAPWITACTWRRRMIVRRRDWS